MAPWLSSAILGTLLVAPLLALIGIAGKFAGPIHTLFWYTLGLAGGCFLLSPLGYWNISELRPTKLSMAILVCGVTFGLVANYLLFRSSALAPNPGYAFAIAVCGNYLSIPFGALMLRYATPQVEATPITCQHIMGILLIVAGTYVFFRRS